MTFILNTCQTFMSDYIFGVVDMVTPILTLEWYPEEAVDVLFLTNFMWLPDFGLFLKRFSR